MVCLTTAPPGTSEQDLTAIVTCQSSAGLEHDAPEAADGQESPHLHGVGFVAHFKVGSRVLIHSLVSETGKQWNAKRGLVHCTMPGSGRVGVLIDGQDAPKSFSVSNVQPLSPPLSPYGGSRTESWREEAPAGSSTDSSCCSEEDGDIAEDDTPMCPNGKVSGLAQQKGPMHVLIFIVGCAR